MSSELINGMIVDTVSEVISVLPNEMEPAPTLTNSASHGNHQSRMKKR